MRNNLHCGSQASQGPRIARRHRGFTLIELMVTMALVAVLLRIGIPSFVSFQRNSELTSAANGLLASVNSARTEAMKRNMNAGLVPTTGSSWGGGWTAFVDIDGNGSFDAAKDLVVSTQPALASYFFRDRYRHRDRRYPLHHLQLFRLCEGFRQRHPGNRAQRSFRCGAAGADATGCHLQDGPRARLQADVRDRCRVLQRRELTIRRPASGGGSPPATPPDLPPDRRQRQDLVHAPPA